MARGIVCVLFLVCGLLPAGSARSLLRKPAPANLTADADDLHSSLQKFLQDHATPDSKDDHGFGQTFMANSQRILAELTEGKKTADKIKMTEQLVKDLQAWSAHTTGRMKEMKHKMSEDDANWLMKLLVERQKLPMATQLAVLKRKDVAELPWAQRLMKDHKDSPSLADQFRAILEKNATDIKVKVGHRIAIDRTKAGDKLRDVQKKVGEMQGQVSTLVAQMTKDFQADPELSKDPQAQKLLKEANDTVERMKTDILKNKLKDLKEVGHDLKSLEKLEAAKKEAAKKA